MRNRISVLAGLTVILGVSVLSVNIAHSKAKGKGDKPPKIDLPKPVLTPTAAPIKPISPAPK